MSPLYVFTIVGKFSQGAKRPKKEADDPSSKRGVPRGAYRKKSSLQRDGISAAKGHVPTQVACGHVAMCLLQSCATRSSKQLNEPTRLYRIVSFGWRGPTLPMCTGARWLHKMARAMLSNEHHFTEQLHYAFYHYFRLSLLIKKKKKARCKTGLCAMPAATSYISRLPAS